MKSAYVLSALAYFFKDERLFQQALTHRSFSSTHNERLEFLGDSVLNLCIGHILYQQFPNIPEGELSRFRSHLVREETLHKIAIDFQLPNLLRLGEGEVRSGGRTRPSILADAVEALIAAVYLDAGFDAAFAAVQKLYRNIAMSPEILQDTRDAKTQLQEYLQAKKKKLPQYTVVKITGADHEQNFEVECVVEHAAARATGSGASKRLAEQAAAKAVLAILAMIESKK